jgi:hypothetical protein
MRKNPIQSKSINHSVSPKEAASVASLKGTITLTLKKKTLSQVYNQVKMCEELGFPNFSKGEPINNLMREIKREVKKESKQEKMGWKELLEFWPLSIVIPSMLILILMANVFQW